MNKGWISLVSICLTAGSVALAETAKPAPAPPAAGTTPATQPAEAGQQLAIRAQIAFNRGEYTTALPILKKIASMETDPAKLGPIQERIRVCEKGLASLKTDPQAAATIRNDGPPTAETRKPHPAPKAGEVLETTIKNLGNFEYDQEHGGNIPDDVKRLSGATVRLRGFMIPMDQAENITQFALVPSLFSCCIGQPPQIQHTVVVNCPKGKAVGYSPDELLVEGVLKVEEKKDEGYVVSIFEMQVNSVKLAPR